MLQLNLAFNIIIHPMRVTISESFFLVRYEITDDVHKDFLK